MADSLTICSEMTDLSVMIVLVFKMGIIVREMGMVLSEIEDKAKEFSEVPSIVEVEDAVGLTEVQTLGIQE